MKNKIYTKEESRKKKIYYLNHRKEILLKHQLRKKEIQDYNKDYYRFNKEKELKRNKDWRNSHKIELIEYYKNKKQINKNFWILHCLRSRINKSLKRNSKSRHTLDLIGCSINFLKKHLQSKFKSGMSWSNYGKWHVDHIRPCASFDLSKELEQRKCFHYTNLQPLWALENLRKSSKYD